MPDISGQPVALIMANPGASRGPTRSSTVDFDALQRKINGLPPVASARPTPSPSRNQSYGARSAYDTDKDVKGLDTHVEHAFASGTDVDAEEMPGLREDEAEGRMPSYTRGNYEDGDDDFEDAVDYQPANVRDGPSGGTTAEPASLDMPPETVHDPYVKSQWARIKKLSDPIPPMRSLGLSAPDTHGPDGGPAGANAGATDLADAMERHFRAVLDLQTEIAAMHLQLEDSGEIKVGKRPNPAPAAEGSTTSSSAPGLDKDAPPPADPSAGDDAGFAALQRREEGVKEIFGRVDELSRMLGEFHELRLPKLAFSFDDEAVPGGEAGAAGLRDDKGTDQPKAA